MRYRSTVPVQSSGYFQNTVSYINLYMLIYMLMCGVGAKSVAHLMKFHLLQWEVVKVKFLINSNMTLTVLNLH